MKILQGTVLSGIMLFIGVLGAYSQWPTTITLDAAMHAEVVYGIQQQGFMRTWEPYTANEFTYPPLFHYLAFLLPFEPIDAVRMVGLLLWGVLPVAMYVLLRTYREDAASVGAVLVGLVPSFSNVFIYSEFPQLMSMVLLLWEWYLLRRGKTLAAGVVVGLIALTHVFFVLVAVALYLVYILKEERMRWQYGVVRKGEPFAHMHKSLLLARSRKLLSELKEFVVPILIALPWMPAYVKIIRNVLLGQWENTRYNAVQPVFGFWQWDTLKDWFWGVDGLTPVLVLLAVFGFFYTKDRVLRGMFVLCMFLTVFHIPFTQLKILDLLAIPMVMLAALGLVSLPIKRHYRSVLIVVVVIVLAFAQVQHFYTAKHFWLNPEIAPTEELADAARWLGDYDGEWKRVYAHQASAWVGVLSHKLPLDPDITYLEAFSEEYKEQLAYNERIKEALEKGEDVKVLLAQRDVRYVIVPVELEPQLELLYKNEVWGVWR